MQKIRWNQLSSRSSGVIPQFTGTEIAAVFTDEGRLHLITANGKRLEKKYVDSLNSICKLNRVEVKLSAEQKLYHLCCYLLPISPQGRFYELLRFEMLFVVYSSLLITFVAIARNSAVAAVITALCLFLIMGMMINFFERHRQLTSY